MTYCPPIDGLRAVAILAVLLFHAFPGTFSGGFTGVDLFFVISGYLIASIVLLDIRAKSFTLREFYIRRILRLLPNAMVTLFVTLVLASIYLLPSSATQLARHAFYTLFNLSNIFIWHYSGNYWGEDANSLPLLHTWSLAVEEQFYLLFPALLSLLCIKPKLLWAVPVMAIVSFFANYVYSQHDPASAFYLLHTRAWEPLVGAMLALYRIPPTSGAAIGHISNSWVSEVLGVMGFATVVLGFCIIDDNHPFPGLTALVPTVAGLAILVGIVENNTFVARFLARSPLVWIGKLSYSLYLWHWPFLSIARNHAELLQLPSKTISLLACCVGIGVSVVAYYLIEEPFRRRAEGRERRLLITGVTFVFGLAAFYTVSLRRIDTDPRDLFEQVRFFGFNYTVGDSVPVNLSAVTRYVDVEFPRSSRERQRMWETGGIIRQWGGPIPQVVVLGSSYALMYGHLIDDICKRLEISVAFLSADGSPMFFPTKVGISFVTPELASGFDAARLKWIKEWSPKLVIAADKWDDNFSGGDLELAEKLLDVVVRLEPHVGRLVFLSQPPVLPVGQDVNLRELATWQVSMAGAMPTLFPDEHELHRKRSVQIIEALSEQFPKVEQLRVDSVYYHPDGSVNYYSGRNFYYADYFHLSDSGAELAREMLTKSISTVFGRLNSDGLDDKS